MSESSSPRPNGGDAAKAPSVVIKKVSYLRSSLRVILWLLPIWFFVSYGCGILFRDWLDANAPKVGNAPFGFWMAQQGSVFCFVIILVVYAVWMNKLDKKYNISE